MRLVEWAKKLNHSVKANQLVKKQPNRWLVFSSLAMQMGVLFYGAVHFGAYLDHRFESDQIATLGCSILALIVSIYLIHQQSHKL